MPYDLRHEPWIPWGRASGATEWGPLSTLLTRLDDDPVVALAAPRPDFDGALQELLIGLLTVALQPEDEAAWRDWWHDPPTTDELQAALDALPAAFYLDGDGPRFFQDLSAEECSRGKRWTIESLLIGTPGSTWKDAERRIVVNDLFVKPGRITRLSRPAAAMALVTLQTYAPEGGRGHLTSLRGGGPLTTLVDPRAGQANRPRERALWNKLWANVATREQTAERSPDGAPSLWEAVFPWLAHTRAADSPRTEITTPADAHALQSFFAMPRRIRLEFAGTGRCDLTGCPDAWTVESFHMRPYGVDYEGWQHPLSPQRRDSVGKPWRALRGQAGGPSWKDWAGLTLWAPDGALRRPAEVVPGFQRRAAALGCHEFRLHAFGFATDQNKARAWTDAALPVLIASDDRHPLLLSTATQLIDATGLAGAALLRAVKEALFQNGENASGDLSEAGGELWHATEPAFYEAMRAIADAGTPTIAAVELSAERRRVFSAELLDRATAIFDRWCPAAGLAPEAMRRRVAARYDLVSVLRGYSPLGEKLFTALGLALPGGGRAARAGRKRTGRDKEATT